MNLRKSIREEIQNNKLTFAVYCIVRIFVIGCLAAAIIDKNWENVFYCLLTLVLFMLPSIAEKTLKIELPTAVEIIILLFIFCAEVLGEMYAFYVKIPLWDTMLHATNGFLCAAFGFCLVDLLNRNAKAQIKLSPLYLAIVAFCLSMTVGVLWEFFEFGMDLLFATDMQKDTIINSFNTVMLDATNSNKAVAVTGISEVYINGDTALGLGGYLDIGLYDTMKDLFINFVGATVFSIIGYFYVKSEGKSRIAKKFIPVVLDEKTDK